MEGEASALGIAGLWLAFLATHVAGSSLRWRPALVRALGTNGFLGAYSLVALVIFGLLVWFYAGNKHGGPFLWYGSTLPGMRWAMYLGMVISMTLIAGSFFTPSPTSIGASSHEVRGVLRVTRHPLFMGVGLLGLLHLCVAQIHLNDLIFFAGLPLVSLLGCWHQDQRKRVTEGEAFHRFLDETALLPFGRGGLSGLVESPAALLVGIASTVALRWFHPVLFGGA